MLKISHLMSAALGSLLVLGSAALHADSSATPPDVRSFAGVWRASEYKVAANTDLDVQVWGRNASKVRNVQLAMEPDGSGTLRVQQSVVDARGRVRPYSASVIEARVQIEMPVASAEAARVEPTVKVLQAVERYLDGTNDRRAIDGLTVSMSLPRSDSNSLNIRFDTREGTGSFGETLTRGGRGTTKRS